MDVFSLWLVRLPEATKQAGQFSFHDFNVSPNRIAFEARLSQDGYVLLNEIDYPGWKATVDGQPAEILRADGIFRALWVPAGSHRIDFRFWPRFLIPGAAISLATLISVSLALAASRPSKWAAAEKGEATVLAAESG
ncbi:MAG: YfhO family protein [Acidobacteria bacterium]|nr:YfhO family protein [Acidobacteriota bacterium]MCI0722342.1 YfhO family protein [Acidobacteriota bacterium]